MAEFDPVTLKIKRRDGKRFTIRFENPDGTPLSLVGRTYASQIRVHSWDATVLAAIEITPNLAAGILSCRIPPAAARTFPDNAVWDLQETVNGESDTILGGPVETSWDVTE